MIHRLLPGLAAMTAVVMSASAARADFSSCVASLKSEAARAGVSAATLKVAFDGVQPDMKVLDFQKSQPEFKTPIWDYMAALVDDERVADGKAAMAQHARGLAYAEQTYGVPRTMLVAIWGVESNFGSDMGGRPLVQSLSTLACFGQRAGYFRSELMAALKIIDRGDIPADKLAGSWAGAFGQTQFMPSSYLRLAAPGVDGSRDIVDSADAALASTARYFDKSGWRPLGAQGQGADVLLGRAWDRPRRRAPAGIGRGRSAAAGRRGRPRFPRHQKFRRRLFLQRRRILFAGRLHPRGSARGRAGHPDALADRRSRTFARRAPRAPDAAHPARL